MRPRTQALLISTLLSLLGCPAEGPATAPGELARVDDEVITAADFQRRFWQGPRPVRKRAMGRGGRHYLLDLVIDEHLLALEAERRSLSPRFSEIRPFHQELLSRFLAKEFEHTLPLSAISEEEIQAEYEVVRPTLVQPARRQLRVYIEKSRSEAARLHARIKALHDERDEPTLLEIYNQQVAAEAGAQKGVFEFEKAVTYLGDELARAAWAVDVDEGILPEPVRSNQGWAVALVLIEYEAFEPPPLSKVARQMRERVHARRREVALDQLVDTFRGDHQVTIYQEALELVPWAAPPAEQE